MITACMIALPLTANAALVSLDWQTDGDNLITRDDYGLEWLDLTVTANRSYNDICQNYFTVFTSKKFYQQKIVTNFH